MNVYHYFSLFKQYMHKIHNKYEYFLVYILPLSIHILQFFENSTIIFYINNLFIKNIKKSFITY